MLKRSRCLCLPALGLAWLLCGTIARAQTIEVLNTTDVDRDPERDKSQQPRWISRDDCLNDTTFIFKLNLANTDNRTLEVWVAEGSNNCDAVDSRQGDARVCWRVLRQTVSDGSLNLEFKAAELLPEAEADCESEDDNTSPQALMVNFMLMDGTDKVTSATWKETSYDLLGPEPPHSVKAGIGDEQIPLSWKVSETTEDASGYHFYCAPADSSGDGQSGGAGGEGSGEAECTSSVLIPGETPDPAYRCGSVSGLLATSGDASGDIENGQVYAVAVVAEDQVGNEGVLSEIACAHPQEVKGFFEAYRQAGGKGGGGYCAMGARRSGVGAGLLGVGCLFWLVRRSRRPGAQPQDGRQRGPERASGRGPCKAGAQP